MGFWELVTLEASTLGENDFGSMGPWEHVTLVACNFGSMGLWELGTLGA